MSILDQIEAEIFKKYKRLNLSAYFIKRLENYRKLEDKNRKKMTPEAFNRWREKELLYSKWSRDLIQEMADEISKTNKAVQTYVRKQMDAVYKEAAKAGLEMAALGIIGMKPFNSNVRQGLQNMGITYTVTAKGKGPLIPPTISNTKLVGKFYNKVTLADIETAQELLLPPISEDTKILFQQGVRDFWNVEKINSQMVTGIKKGESIPKMAKRMENVASMNRAQAVRNARTMATNVRNRSVFDRGRDLEALGFKVTKTWRTAEDSRVRDLHKAIDGEEVNLYDTFSNGLRWPADQDGEPAEVYNCRCAMELNLNDSGLTENEAEEILGV